jgi:riboflavin kinase/FMN adenylyltransferase
LELFSNIQHFKSSKPLVVTIGTFDGVHTGHRKIIGKLMDAAQKIEGESAILTFNPHPRTVLFPDSNQVCLNTNEEKAELLRQTGIDNLIVHPFTREFSLLSSDQFIRDYLVKQLNTKYLVVGFDHHFGKDRQGNFTSLKETGNELGFQVEEISVEESDNHKISSTRIRQALLDGNVKVANDLLGYEYMISGTVVKGKQLGRTIGYPTANIFHENGKLIPKNGVYAVSVVHSGQTYNGMMNIGTRPTVNGTDRSVEVNIFDFSKDIYGEKIRVHIIDRLRDEKKFDGIENLKLQIAEDAIRSAEILNKQK